MLLEWLFENYARVREGAGLKPLPPIDGVMDQALLKLMMANAMITLLEFSELRSSSTQEKNELRHVRLTLEKTLER
jgi:hypothetical protein